MAGKAGTSEANSTASAAAASVPTTPFLLLTYSTTYALVHAHCKLQGLVSSPAAASQYRSSGTARLTLTRHGSSDLVCSTPPMKAQIDTD